MSTEEYTIQGGREGKRRLDLLGTITDHHTARFLDDLGVPQGISALDVGCGGGNVTLQIARRVGPSGRVVGIDFDLEVLECARDDAKAAGLENVEFRTGDARAPDGGPYDLVAARFVLCHLAGPERVLAALVAALRPGGLLMIEDTDFTGMFTIPGHPITTQAVDVYRETLRRGAGDADIGQRLPLLLRAAGLESVSVAAVQPILEGEQRQLMASTLRMMKPHVIGRGVLTADAWQALVTELSAFLDDPEVLVGCPRVIQAAGRVPLKPGK
jgi:ubiquinone/menaquinone biosynthesis C-methylase UbiE